MVYRLRWLVSYFKCQGSPQLFIRTIGGSVAKELSIFVDESGDRGGKARYYLLTLVFHDQAESITEAVTGYEAKISQRRAAGNQRRFDLRQKRRLEVP